MERPNTVAGLIEKRRVTLANLKLAQADAQRLTADLDALDRVIGLFAPEIEGRGFKAKRLPPPYAARKGEMQRAVMDTMREADGPVTSLMIAQRFCEARGLEADGPTLTMIRNRASGTLGKMCANGAVQAVALAGGYKGWTL